jgi:hypothetical protein
MLGIHLTTLQIFRTFTDRSSHRYVNPLGFQHLNPNWKLYTIYTVSFRIFIRISFDILTLVIVLDCCEYWDIYSNLCLAPPDNR